MKTGDLTLGTLEAKNCFSELIERVRNGGEVTITRHDRPVARLVAASSGDSATRRAVDAWLAERERYRLGGLSVRSLVDEGRP